MPTTRQWYGRDADWERYFADGLRAAVSAAVERWSGSLPHTHFSVASPPGSDSSRMPSGELPDGSLYDPHLKGWSADEVYERIVKDLRRFGNVATFAGIGVCDVPPGEQTGGSIDLDGFYRRALANGLDYHAASDRGLLPAGLVEEIRARSHPPIGWEVELARAGSTTGSPRPNGAVRTLGSRAVSPPRRRSRGRRS